MAMKRDASSFGCSIDISEERWVHLFLSNVFNYCTLSLAVLNKNRSNTTILSNILISVNVCNFR